MGINPWLGSRGLFVVDDPQADPFLVRQVIDRTQVIFPMFQEFGDGHLQAFIDAAAHLGGQRLQPFLGLRNQRENQIGHEAIPCQNRCEKAAEPATSSHSSLKLGVWLRIGVNEFML